jgi:imidazolonepropionase-like amidohydrolase
MTKIIRAGCLIDGTGQRPLHDAVVVIEDGKIKEVGSAENVSFPEKYIEIDASDRTVMPGLIDDHVHLALGASDDPVWNKVKGDLGALCFYAAGNAQKALVSGITTLGDCGSVGSVTIRLREAIKAKILAGPRLVVSGTPITTTSGHLYWIGVHADNADELRKSVRQLVEKGVDFIKIMATGGAMTPISNRRRAQYSEAELTAAVEDAHRLKRRVVVHVNGTEGIRNAVKAGVDVLAHCNWMGKKEDSIEYDESVAKSAAEKGIYADLGPIGGFTEQDSRWSLGCKMKNLGVDVYLSSDGIGRQAARFPADVKSLVENTNITPLEAIKMATKIPAEALGLGSRLGTIEPGKDADLLIVDGNPLDDIAALERVDTVLLNGEAVALNGNLCVAGLHGAVSSL